MKKKFKIVSLLILVVVSFMSILNVYAVDNMVINDKQYIQTSFSNGAYRREAFYVTNKGVAYCVTPDKVGGQAGSSLPYVETKNSGSILYLLNKAGDSKDAFVVTQLAIWKIVKGDDYLPTVNYKYNNFDAQARSLATEARNNSNYSNVPSLKFYQSTLSFTESSDGNYYVSNEITVISSGTDVATIRLDNAPDGTIVTDDKGNEKNTFNNNERFIVKVPTGSVSDSININVSASASGSELSYEKYSGGNWQDLVVLVKTKKDVSQSIEGTITPEKRTCEKTANGKYYGKEGTEVTADEYDLECNVHKCEIVSGKYFDNNGNLTDEATYKAQCETVVPVPNTANSNNLVYTVLGIVLIAGTAIGIKTYRKNN